ncbi:MAG: Co2+/Mg2+ efflux protein ApaG [Thiohalospira sp.]
MTQEQEDPRYRIRVDVESRFIPEQSEPDEGRHVFAYTVTIRNEGSEAAQLLDRHWIITDADGQTQEVQGEGVVGEQPRLEPGQAFQYTSGTVLRTAVGSMHGTYGMVADDGHRFDAPIAPFSLQVPGKLH